MREFQQIWKGSENFDSLIEEQYLQLVQKQRSTNVMKSNTIIS